MCIRDRFVYDPVNYEQSEFLYRSNVGKIVGVKAGTHAMSAVLYDSFTGTSSSVGGMLSAELPIGEYTENLYVYIPYYPEINTEGGVETARSSAILSNVLSECGIGPVSTTPVPEDTTCTITYADAEEVG